MKIYLSSPMFSEADRLYNQYIASKLRQTFKHLQLYVPQENQTINNKEKYADSLMIYAEEQKRIRESDLIISIIDGIEIDSGVACIIGEASLLSKPIFALYTDIRQQGTNNQDKIDALIEECCENQFSNRNLYVIGKIKSSGGNISVSIEKLICNIRNYFVEFQDDL